jgi:hypothetical protein
MKKRTILVLLFVGLLCGACTFIVKKINHVTNPKFETKESVTRFLERSGRDYPDHLFVCRDSASYFGVISKGQAFPQALFFNSKGENLKYAEDACPGKAMTFAKNLGPQQDFVIDTSYTWDFIAKRIMPCGPALIPDISAHRFTMAIFWVVWAGKVNDNAFEIAEAMKKRPGLDIQTLFINMDLLDTWGMKKFPTFKTE